MSRIRIRSLAIPAGVVDRQSDMVTVEALKKAEASWRGLRGSAVYHCFDLNRPIGVVETVDLREDGLHVVMRIVREPPRPFNDYVIRASFRAKKLHMEGQVQVIDEMELRAFSLVPIEDAA